jgi:hypothetical protein
LAREKRRSLRSPESAARTAKIANHRKESRCPSSPTIAYVTLCRCSHFLSSKCEPLIRTTDRPCSFFIADPIIDLSISSPFSQLIRCPWVATIEGLAQGITVRTTHTEITRLALARYEFCMRSLVHRNGSESGRYKSTRQ